MEKQEILKCETIAQMPRGNALLWVNKADTEQCRLEKKGVDDG
jgi:hypothetical protein